MVFRCCGEGDKYERLVQSNTSTVRGVEAADIGSQAVTGTGVKQLPGLDADVRESL